ncbi:MAG: glycosyltransferase, partial [Pseudomonadota bacterium]
VKGIRVLFEAVERLADQIPNLRLILVGDGPDRANLERAAQPLGDLVQFTGYKSQAEVADLMQSSDIFVLPSFAEGVPVVLMEAMASARPVIATQVAGVGELVEEGQSGFMVPPGDVESLMARIRILAGDADMRARMGRNGREKVLADFDIETEASRLLRLFADQAGDAIRPEPQDRAAR